MDYIAIIEEALRKGKEAFSLGTHKQVGYGAYGDVSYDNDKIVEKEISSFILSKIPDAKIITEESGLIGKEDAKTTILLDPVDGTTNSVRGLPFYCSAIAIAEGNRFKDIVASGVMSFVSKDLIVSQKGKGVFHNKKVCSLSSNRKLRSALICMDIKSNGKIVVDRERFAKLVDLIKYPRALGAAALEIAFVACGIVDAYIEARKNLRAFDCLPSLFMIKENKGFIKSFDNDLNDFELSDKRRLAFLAANSEELGKEILELIGVEK